MIADWVEHAQAARTRLSRLCCTGGVLGERTVLAKRHGAPLALRVAAGLGDDDGGESEVCRTSPGGSSGFSLLLVSVYQDSAGIDRERLAAAPGARKSLIRSTPLASRHNQALRRAGAVPGSVL